MPERVDCCRYPFTIPAFRNGIDLHFEKPVTIFVGENGSGKSTLLEAIAELCGFNLEGGNRNHSYSTAQQGRSELARSLKLSWMPKTTNGFFMRAESFFNFATYIDGISGGNYKPYGGRSLHEQSHGESFLALFTNRFDKGLYILDEPEAALSPQRQLSFLCVVHDLEMSGRAQFLIATHSPIILAYPDAAVLTLDAESIQPIDYRDTEHFQLMKRFLGDPDLYFKHLFAEEITNARGDS